MSTIGNSETELPAEAKAPLVFIKIPHPCTPHGPYQGTQGNSKMLRLQQF